MNYCAIGRKRTRESDPEGEKAKSRTWASVIDGEGSVFPRDIVNLKKVQIMDRFMQ
jgi:hypothetical protein